MSIAALFLAVTAGPQPVEAPAPRQEVSVAGAQVSVSIVRPAIVRQGKGLELPRADAPRPQITRRGTEVLVEFQ